MSLFHAPRHDMDLDNNKDLDKFSRKQEKDILTKMVKKKSKKRNMFFRLPGNPKNMRRNNVKKKKQKAMKEKNAIEAFIGMKWDKLARDERAKFLNAEDEATKIHMHTYISPDVYSTHETLEELEKRAVDTGRVPVDFDFKHFYKFATKRYNYRRKGAYEVFKYMANAFS